MISYLLKRLVALIPTVFFVTVIIFGLQQLLPGDPAIMLAGEDQDPTVIAYLHKKMHLDEPLPMRYAYWIGGVFKGDLGESLRIQKPVLELIQEKLPVTLELAAIAMLVQGNDSIKNATSVVKESWVSTSHSSNESPCGRTA